MLCCPVAIALLPPLLCYRGAEHITLQRYSGLSCLGE